ncbi:hypothetical protein ATANTOWER_009411, partial [Ataeniobius toweri]|nr:hypothetical protein [Ataeniobius toweri]
GGVDCHFKFERCGERRTKNNNNSYRCSEHWKDEEKRNKIIQKQAIVRKQQG